MARSFPGTIGTTAAPDAVIHADTPTRLAFLRKVYAIFGGSMVLWMGTTLVITFNQGMMEALMPMMMTGGFLMAILLMGAVFMVLRMTANSYPMNLVGLGLFAVLEGLLTAPLVYMALAMESSDPTAWENLTQGVISTDLISMGTGMVTQAFVLTSAIFTGLTVYALTTKRDFLWLRGGLYMAMWALLAIGLLSYFGIGEGFVGGWGYSMLWVVLMGGFVLYDTQNIMKRYPEHMAVTGAAMLLFDFVVMFQRILMLLMSRRN